MPIIFAIIGSIFRRWWGGWLSPSHWLKVPLGYALAFAVGFLATWNLYAALAFGVVIGSAFLNPWHGWGAGMGLDGSGKSTSTCVFVMAGSYGLYTTIASIFVSMITGNMWFLLYAVTGFLTPLAYYESWIAFNKDKNAFRVEVAGSGFLDGPTTVGEVFLGALLFAI